MTAAGPVRTGSCCPCRAVHRRPDPGTRLPSPGGGRCRQRGAGTGHAGRRQISVKHATDALAEAGQHQRAAVMASQAETAARSITYEYDQVRALTAAAGALAKTSQREQAAVIASHAETVARSITPSPTRPDEHARTLTEVARALAEAGHCEQAATIAPQAEPVARSAGTGVRSASRSRGAGSTVQPRRYDLGGERRRCG